MMPTAPTEPTSRAVARRLLLAGGAFALAILSCGREPTAPGGDAAGVQYSQALSWISEFPSGVPAFQAAGGSGVSFTKVRVILNFPNGSVALDTVVSFPAGTDELTVTLSVALPASTPAGGQPLALNLKYVNAAGNTVFRGGPVTVNAVPATPGSPAPPASPVVIPITYTGPGANATSVVISPRTLTVNTGGAFQFSAVALDASGTPVPNTPIVFVAQNTTLAVVNAATGVGTAGSTRGTTDIVAQLLTGQTDAAALTIQAPASSIAAVSGGDQAGPVGALLTQPVVVHVTATDGQPAPGVAVTFAAENGGTVGAATVTTDAGGNAQTTWRLGGSVGVQALTASVSGLAGSPVMFTATARAVNPVRLVVATQPPASSPAGTAFGLVVQAVDATGALTPTFAGAVTVALGTGAPTGAVLAGTTTATAVAGIATFTDLKLSVPGAYTLELSASGLLGSTSNSFQITAGTATRLAFQGYPVAGAVAGAVFDAITVEVRDALGNAVTTFTGPVTLEATSASAAARDTAGALPDSAAGGAAPAGAAPTQALLGTTTVNAAAGVATFTGLRETTAGRFVLTASATGLTTATGPAFSVTPGPASTLLLLSGGGQSAVGATAVPNPIVVRVSDAFGNPVPGATVAFAPAAASGSVSPSSGVTNAAGEVQTVWTLGALAGANTLNVTGAGLTPNPLVVGATVTASAGGVVSQLVFTTQPSSGVAGVGMPSIVVTAKDVLGAVVTTFTDFVNIGIGANPGGGIIWSGTVGTGAVAGVATFPGVSLTKVGVGYTIVATSGALVATSAPFDVTPGVAVSISADSGNAQTGTVGTALSSQLVVKAEDQFSNGVPGVAVAWAVAAGGGALSGTTSTTDATGRARTTLTLGPLAGTDVDTVNATNGAVSGSPVIFTATAVSGAAASIVADSGNAPTQAAVVGQQLPAPFVARVLDALGNPVAGVTVAWIVTGGSGSLGGVTTTTDAAGRVRATLTTGPTPGANTATATASGVGTPATFTANGLSAIANIMWTGAVSTDWNTAGNWSPAAVPTATDSVLVSAAGNQPVLSGNATTARFTLQSGATLALGNFNLEASGSVDVPATGVSGTTGKIRMNGASTTVVGVFTNLEIFGGLTTAAGSIAVTGTLTISGGQYDVAGFATTVSTFTASGSGRLLMQNAAGSLTTGTANWNATGWNDTQLTAGTLHVQGNWAVSCSGSTVFNASGTHTVIFDGTAAQNVAGTCNSGTLATQDHFRNVSITNTTATVTLTGTHHRTGSLFIDPGATVVGAFTPP